MLRAAPLAFILLLGGCSTKPLAPAPPPPRPAAAIPADWPAPLPATLTGPERIWHLRAALNVAALACPTKTGNAIIGNYNALLKSRKSLLAGAYKAEVAVFRDTGGSDWQAAFDRYMTKLYNRYAWPPAQSGFCTTADNVAAEALKVSPGDFEAFATTALARIEQALAYTPPVETIARIGTAPLPVAAATAIGNPWRIQLGAFTGQPAADAAWLQIKARLPGLAGYTPHFEAVSGKPGLVRLQIGNATDRGSALTLCALAAAGGFDCIPVRPTG